LEFRVELNTPAELESKFDSSSKLPMFGLSATWFFLILTSYYFLKPLRDGLASSLAGNFGNLYLATFVTSIVALGFYSFLVARVDRLRLVFIVHQFFVVCLIAFGMFVANKPPAWIVAVFFVWVSVFNVFLVTMFWSVMADYYSVQEGKAWFGWIAAGGSVGSLFGSGMAFVVNKYFGMVSLVVAAIVLLELAVLVAFLLDRKRREFSIHATKTNPENVSTRGTGGTILDGLRLVFQSRYLLAICLFVLLGKFAATFFYNNLQLVMKAEVSENAQRVELFSQINFFGQGGSLFLQFVVAGWMMSKFGMRFSLVLPTVVTIILFLLVIAWPALSALMIGQVIQQCLAYGLLVPVQNVLFTVVSREEKYKSKAFMDTVVFRGGDVLAGKVCDGLSALQISLAALSAFVTPVVCLWTVAAAYVGYLHVQRSHAVGDSEKPSVKK
jgi:ATP:ADP antiporter, AAA family